MKWGGTSKEPDRSMLHVTPPVTPNGMPVEAHKYVFNGRTPPKRAVNRLQNSQHIDSKVVNDPNA